MNYIVSAAHGGLSNRIKCLISSVDIAKRTGRSVLLYWAKNKDCNSTFSELFENNITGISKEELRKILKSKDSKVILEGGNFLLEDKKYIINELPIFSFVDKKQDYHFYKTPQEIRLKIIRYLRTLKIKKSIQEEVEDFYGKRFGGRIVGVHIRKGDFVFVENGVGNVSSERMFIKKIKEEIAKNKETKFFLATEDIGTEKRIKELFNNRLLIYSKKTTAREEEGSVKEALIEMLLLSKTGKILGNFRSSFTEMAWFFGECKPQIEIVIDKTHLKEHLKKIDEGNNIKMKIKKSIYELITPHDKRFFGKD